MAAGVSSASVWNTLKMNCVGLGSSIELEADYIFCVDWDLGISCVWFVAVLGDGIDECRYDAILSFIHGVDGFESMIPFL